MKKVEQFYIDIERAMADSDSKSKIITESLMQKLELKEKKKTSKAWEHLELGPREMQDVIPR